MADVEPAFGGPTIHVPGGVDDGTFSLSGVDKLTYGAGPPTGTKFAPSATSRAADSIDAARNRGLVVASMPSGSPRALIKRARTIREKTVDVFAHLFKKLFAAELLCVRRDLLRINSQMRQILDRCGDRLN
jgi:hypothetical protein